MDCFFAAVEIRDNPKLKNKPVAVGSSESRGVITTCNYIARKFGIKSAMPSVTAKKLCPELIFVPVQIEKYRDISNEILNIYKCYTKIIEPIALDEAYLDVTSSKYCEGNPEKMAYQIRKKIHNDFNLTASAGIASNKFLSKIASDWNKPDGQFSISDSDISKFIINIPIRKIMGIGKVNEKKLLSKNIKTCGDLQKLKQDYLINLFGKYGETLFYLCRGIDQRKVESNRIRKSLSVEDTFEKDLSTINECLTYTRIIFDRLVIRYNKYNEKIKNIKSCFIKIKFNNFRVITAQKTYNKLDYEIFKTLLKNTYKNNPYPIRLLGLGVTFDNEDKKQLFLNIDWYNNQTI